MISVFFFPYFVPMSVRSSVTARWASLDRGAKIEIVLSFLFRLSMLVGLVATILRFQWPMVFVIFLGLLSTFLPSLLQKNFFRNLPSEFELLFTLFVYGSFYLGEHEGFYGKFWWWDKVLHSGSGIGLGLVGFLFLYSFYTKGTLQISPFLIALFSFTFALALGALWEIFEFSMDQIFSTNMQTSGIVDTMWDLIMDALGALSMSIIGYLHLQHCLYKRDKGIVHGLIHRLIMPS